MRKVRSGMPQLETLEDVTLLSGLLPGTGAPTVVPEVAKPPLELLVNLNGKTHGTYTKLPGPPDVSKYIYNFKTTGKFDGYGPAQVQGSVHTAGFIKAGRAGGTLQVKIAKGTLTLKLTGLILTPSSRLPTYFAFQITKGTGIFNSTVIHPVGQGTLKVDLMPNVSSAAAVETGKVTLTFQSRLVPVG